MLRLLSVAAVAAASILSIAGAWALEGEVGEYSNARIEAHVVEPRKLEASEQTVAKLQAPDGFAISVFAKDVKNPRMLAVSGDGTVYATRREIGDVVMLRDDNKDGKADAVSVVASRPGMHGIAIDGRKMYLVTVADVYVADIKDDGTLSDLVRIIDDLPDSGQDPNRTIAVGKDGMLYISVGSTCNACDESRPESAALLRASPDGKQRTIFARGLRNTIGFDWHPETGELYGMDHGIDWLGDDAQVEELNLLTKGKQYGWPYIYGMGEKNPQDEPAGAVTLDDWKAASENPLLGYTAHAAPMQMLFYEGRQFPKSAQGDAFVAMRGSWNRKIPSGYEVVRIRFEDGKPSKIEPFLTGFLQKDGNDFGVIGRPSGLAVTPDGALLVADDTNGVIYRVAYEGAEKDDASRTRPTAGRARKSDELKPSEIAINLVKPSSSQTLKVASAAIAPNSEIPKVYSADGEDISPPLAWTGSPSGTQTFAVIVDDPDAKPTTPFTHWVAWNIPAKTMALREGIPAIATINDPKDMAQGINSRGSVGYFGPKPPEGDPAHNYHFQVFALDRKLDLKPNTTRDGLLAAMDGAVLAHGQLVGTFATPK